MNKIVVVEDILVTDGNYDINFKSNSKLTTSGNIKLNNISDNECINIDIKSNSNILLNKFDKITNDTKINIDIQNDSHFEMNYLIINEGINTVTITVNLRGNRSFAKIKVRSINVDNNSKLNIICNGIILKDTIDNELIEDLKGLEEYGSIKISPNMEVYTNEVVANHLVTLSSFNNTDIFYLTSKGLSENNAKKLLKLGFITQIFDKEFKEKIMEVINCE